MGNEDGMIFIPMVENYLLLNPISLTGKIEWDLIGNIRWDETSYRKCYFWGDLKTIAY